MKLPLFFTLVFLPLAASAITEDPAICEQWLSRFGCSSVRGGQTSFAVKVVESTDYPKLYAVCLYDQSGAFIQTKPHFVRFATGEVRMHGDTSLRLENRQRRPIGYLKVIYRTQEGDLRFEGKEQQLACRLK